MPQMNPLQSEQSPTLITVVELARMLKVSPRTVWRLVSAGKIMKPLHVGGVRRWRYDDVKRWIDNGCPSDGTTDA